MAGFAVSINGWIWVSTEAFVLAVVLATVLYGCGSGSSGSTPTSSTSPSSGSPTSVTSVAVTGTVALGGSAQFNATATLSNGKTQDVTSQSTWQSSNTTVATVSPNNGSVNQRAIHLLVEIEIEAVERALGITKARLFVPALEEAVLPAQELVGHEHRDQIDRGDLFGLGVTQSGFEDGRHAREAELTERTIELDEIHRGSPVCDQ
jgi:hypothetical protein